MSVIDYRGYRVVAMSLLPIAKDTIIYGSADAGETVHASDPAFNQRMSQAAHVLNLKGHKAGRMQTTVFGPADIEGHKSKTDGNYYIVGRTPLPCLLLVYCLSYLPPRQITRD